MLTRNKILKCPQTSPVAKGSTERTNVTTDSLSDWLNAYVLNPVNTVFLRSMTKNYYEGRPSKNPQVDGTMDRYPKR